ncbi:Hypothetical_protein [Hexamita inflata]|uniref:Hypothetical_protein n=1 Tax=Hexamita inflata TaxID=28002 RepID=A0AA86TGQ9_9EUKA|nr:Hypothetical protein HINF_LOCUS4396 [Hexamita inflata]
MVTIQKVRGMQEIYLANMTSPSAFYLKSICAAGLVVECLLATQEIRVRFPGGAHFSFFAHNSLHSLHFSGWPENTSQWLIILEIVKIWLNTQYNPIQLERNKRPLHCVTLQRLTLNALEVFGFILEIVIIWLIQESEFSLVRNLIIFA